MKNFKKVISIFLAVLMVFSSFSVGASATFFGKKNQNNAVTLDFKTNRRLYELGESIIFTVTATNNTDEVKSVKVKVNPKDKDIFNYDGEFSIENIPAKGTKSVKYEMKIADSEDNSFIKKIVKIFKGLIFSFRSFDYKKNITVECCARTVGFNVEYIAVSEPEKPKKFLEIDKSVFYYDAETDGYSIYNDIESINGYLESTEDVKTLEFVVEDIKGNCVDLGVIDISKNWSTKEIGFVFGDNVLTVKAIKNDNTIITDSVSVRCFVDYYNNDIIIDVNTDTDNDGIVDYLETNFTGTDINSEDSDGDGLSDYYEVVVFRYDPLNKDTDNDGILDSDEDYDNDKISNIDEIKLKLDPELSDSDLDGLNDYDEINVYNTDPLNKDTDGDGVSDGDEIKIGSDPLKKETTFSQSETFGEINKYNSISVTVDMELKADQVGSLKIEEINYMDNELVTPMIPGYLGEAYDFTVNGSFDSAKLTFNYDTSIWTIGENFQPRIYYVNEKTGELEELPDQTVSEGTVSATVSHFSTYILLNKVEFDKVWETEIKPPEYQGDGKKGIDVVFVIDSSGSMSWNDENDLRKTVAKKFVEKLGENDRAAVVDFDSYSYLLADFTSDHDTINNAVDRVDSSGGTSLSAGIGKALSLFTSSNYVRTDAYKYIIFLTDGDGDYDSSYTSTAADNGVVIYTVGLGSEVVEDVLKSIASGTNGKYYFASTATDLGEIYEKIEEETVDYTTDSNNDGISDYYTNLISKGILILPNGSDRFKYIDFNYDINGELSDDYDGDGLKNGEEIEIVRNSHGIPIIKMKSDPTDVNSDNDDYTDPIEYQYGGDPFKKSYLTAAINDLRDDNLYNYYYFFKDEDNWLESVSSNIWSTVNFNFSHKDEVTDYVSKVLDKLNELKNVEDLANEAEKVGFVGIIEQALNFVNDSKTVAESVNEIGNLKANLLNLQKAAKHASKISKNMWSQLTNTLDKYEDLKQNYKWYNKFEELEIKGVSVSESIPFINFFAGEVLGTINLTKTYSALQSTAEHFVIYEGILSEIQSNSKKGYIVKGVEPILASINNSAIDFYNSYLEDIATLTIEQGTDLAVSLLTASNPFMWAIDLVKFIGNALGVTVIAENGYMLYVIDDMVSACNSLLHYDYGDTLSSFEDSEKLYFRFIALARTNGTYLAGSSLKKQILIGSSHDAWEKRLESDRARINSAYNLLKLNTIN